MADAPTLEDYRNQAAALSIRNQAFIGGNYVDAASGATFDCVSPIDGGVLAPVAACDEEDVNRAVAAVRKSFNDGVWSGLAPAKRAP